jgi:hypothetical protein
MIVIIKAMSSQKYHHRGPAYFLALRLRPMDALIVRLA